MAYQYYNWRNIFLYFKILFKIKSLTTKEEETVWESIVASHFKCFFFKDVLI